MITEDYVSFETAKLLKERGFDCVCKAYYVKYKDGEVKFCSASKEDDYNNGKYLTISAPTIQMAMKWLREVHHYNIEIDTIGQKCVDTLSWRSVIYNLEQDMECYYEDNFGSYEQACKVAIKYCLENLI